VETLNGAAAGEIMRAQDSKTTTTAAMARAMNVGRDDKGFAIFAKPINQADKDGQESLRGCPLWYSTVFSAFLSYKIVRGLRSTYLKFKARSGLFLDRFQVL
jgi:hypothetical protein